MMCPDLIRPITVSRAHKEACCAPLRLQLNAGALYRFEPNSQPMTVRALNGTLWVTAEGVRLDMVLQPGDEVVLPPRALILVEALREGTIEVDTSR